jgi:hypothetical protein
MGSKEDPALVLFTLLCACVRIDCAYQCTMMLPGVLNTDRVA